MPTLELGSVTLIIAFPFQPLRVADCLRPGIGYTPRARRPRHHRLRIAYGLGSVTLEPAIHPGAAALRIAYGLGSVTLTPRRPRPPVPVADCLRAGIGYTENDPCPGGCSVADCLRAGIGYTPGNVKVRLTCSCGLLTGWDRLHLTCDLPSFLESCGLLTGWDRLHSNASSARSGPSCGLLTGWDRLHYSAAWGRRARRCGLLTGWDRLHCLSRKRVQNRGLGNKSL